MGSLLSDKYKNNIPKITQSTGRPGNKVITGIDQLLLILPKKVPSPLWRKVPQGNKVQSLLRRKGARRRAGCVYASAQQTPDNH